MFTEIKMHFNKNLNKFALIKDNKVHQNNILSPDILINILIYPHINDNKITIYIYLKALVFY